MGRNVRSDMALALSTNERGVSGSVRGREYLSRVSGRWPCSSSQVNINSPKKGGKDNVLTLRGHEGFDEE